MPRIKNNTGGPLILNEVFEKKAVKMEAGGILELPDNAMFNPEIQRLLASNIIKRMDNPAAAKPTTKTAKPKATKAESDVEEVVVATSKTTATKVSTTKKNPAKKATAKKSK